MEQNDRYGVTNELEKSWNILHLKRSRTKLANVGKLMETEETTGKEGMRF